MAIDQHAQRHMAFGALPGTGHRGFTLIELLVVMAIIASLLTLALPHYFSGLEKSKEAVLREDLATMRDAIDKYYADKGAYPDTLNDLADSKYLRNIPKDPITERNDTWQVTPPPSDALVPGNVYDVHSGAEGVGRDGTPYRGW